MGSVYRVTAHRGYQVSVTLQALPYVINVDWIQSSENSLGQWHSLMGPGFAHTVGEQEPPHWDMEQQGPVYTVEALGVLCLVIRDLRHGDSPLQLIIPSAMPVS